MQHIIKLSGLKSDGTPAKTHEAWQVVRFGNSAFNVSTFAAGYALVETNKGTYKLDLHPTIENLYTGVCNGVKVHFTRRKVVAKLIYWAS